MRSWFQKRAYLNKILDEGLVKVRFSLVLLEQIHLKRVHLPVFLPSRGVRFKQYETQTVDEFSNRWNKYKSNDKVFELAAVLFKKKFLNTLIVRAIVDFFENVSITFTDKIYP